MSKITLGNFASFQNDNTAVALANANNAILTTALDNTLSRDGTSPNQMGAQIDMNSNQIINLPAPSTNQSPIRLADLPAGAVNPNFVGGTNITIGGTTISTKANPNFATSVTTPQLNLGSLAVSGIGSGTVVLTSNAWTSYTPVVTAGTGTFTTVSATGRYLTLGKTVFIAITITDTTNGSAATYVTASLPFAPAVNNTYALMGRAGAAAANGNISTDSGGIVYILKYDGTFPLGTGTSLWLSGVYESV